MMVIARGLQGRPRQRISPPAEPIDQRVGLLELGALFPCLGPRGFPLLAGLLVEDGRQFSHRAGADVLTDDPATFPP